MTRHANQTKGLAQHSRPPAQDVSRHKPRAAANHLSPAELTKRDAGAVGEDAAALAAVQAARLPKPPHVHRFVDGACSVCGKPERDWRLHAAQRTQTCNECGRSIEPMADHYFDVVSGHLVRHVECYAKAGSR